jgi:signal transduction histidine kinase
VIDSGIGIKPEDIDKLFKLFGFLDISIELNTKGIGLGLYICKRMVEIFGGKIEVKSEVGVGSTFTYEFQLSEGQIGEKSSVKRLTNPEK